MDSANNTSSSPISNKPSSSLSSKSNNYNTSELRINPLFRSLRDIVEESQTGKRTVLLQIIHQKMLTAKYQISKSRRGLGHAFDD